MASYEYSSKQELLDTSHTLYLLLEEELFIQGSRIWTGTKEHWPMARWIQINSAAPFKSFRRKIRKWKKHFPAAPA